MNTNTLTTLPSKGVDYTLMRDVLEAFTKYLWIFQCLVGLVGNALTAVISLQRNSRQISTCVYMAGLSIADTISLSQQGWGMWTVFYATEPPSELSMRFAYYLAYAFGTLSGFYLAEMTIDRLVAVRFPMLALRICTTKRARITVVVTFLILISLNLYIVFRYRIVVDDITDEASVTGSYEQADHKDFSFMRLYVPEAPIFEVLGNNFQLVVGTFLPFAVIVVCNLWIILTLRSAAKRSDQLGVREEAQKTRQKETTYLTRMLIFVSVAYVITSIPFRLYNILYDVKEIRQMYDFSQEYWTLRQSIEHYVLAYLWYWNYGINFYMYCVGGGKKYRNEVKVILGNIFRCGK